MNYRYETYRYRLQVRHHLGTWRVRRRCDRLFDVAAIPAALVLYDNGALVIGKQRRWIWQMLLLLLLLLDGLSRGDRGRW